MSGGKQNWRLGLVNLRKTGLLKMSHALRIIERNERRGQTGAAWRTVYQGELLPAAPILLPPNARWTVGRQRLLAAYGVGGEFVKFLNNPKYRGYVNSVQALQEDLSRHAIDAQHRGLASYRSLPFNYEVALFGIRGFHANRCPGDGGHMFIAPRQAATCPVHRKNLYYVNAKKKGKP